jgi:UDP-N-acetylmuramyl pentapeptide phosphotransferase/UDP-N-acetylglucosamine-1-phosphate transferase
VSAELQAVLAFAIAAVATYLVTPVAIAVATRTSFFDHPAGYKGHVRPTPYLGGLAIIVGGGPGGAGQCSTTAPQT